SDQCRGSRTRCQADLAGNAAARRAAAATVIADDSIDGASMVQGPSVPEFFRPKSDAIRPSDGKTRGFGSSTLPVAVYRGSNSGGRNGPDNHNPPAGESRNDWRARARADRGSGRASAIGCNDCDKCGAKPGHVSDGPDWPDLILIYQGRGWHFALLRLVRRGMAAADEPIGSAAARGGARSARNHAAHGWRRAGDV